MKEGWGLDWLQRVETPEDSLGISNTTETLEQKNSTSWTSMGQ